MIRSALDRYAHRVLLFLGAGLPFVADTDVSVRTPPLEKSPFQVLTGRAQGTTWQIRYASGQPVLDTSCVGALFAEVDRSLSLYESQSLISVFNRSPHGNLVDSHLARVVEKSIEFHALSHGAFDITVKPLIDLWRDKSTGYARRNVRKVRVCTGSGLLRLKGDSLLKGCPGLQIDCNGIAQGYTVDLLAALVESHGIRDYLVELGGEIRCAGLNPEGEPWTVGIEVPSEEGSVLGKRIRPSGRAVTTSGNWHLEKGIDGRPPVHIMDPRSGRPARNGMVSATVLAADAMTADALDNVCMVLGPSGAVRFIEGFPGADAWLVYRDAKGRLRDTATKGFAAYVMD